MSTTPAPANPKVGFVSLGCPNDIQSIPNYQAQKTA